jgi:hypothetical protein
LALAIAGESTLADTGGVILVDSTARRILRKCCWTSQQWQMRVYLWIFMQREEFLKNGRFSQTAKKLALDMDLGRL